MKYLIDDIDPNECLNSRLRMITRKLNQLYNAHSKELAISFGQQSVLLFVGKHGLVRQSQIGKNLRLERSTVTRELEGLISKGYITKLEDSISPQVKVTETGRTFLNALIPKWIQAQEKARELLGKDGEKAIYTLNNLLLNT